MKVAVTGSHGLIGSELVAELGWRGYDGTGLVRTRRGTALDRRSVLLRVDRQYVTSGRGR